MTVSDNKVVSLNYFLTTSINNQPEKLVEQTSPEHPFVFLYGFGGVLPDFETNLNGKQIGEKFDFKISPENGYGIYEKEYVIKIDRSAFIVDGKFDDERVKVGRDLEMRDADGNPLTGNIIDITDAHVEMDFNHPLAGHELHFIGEVLDVREATQEELDHGHVHGPHGHHH